MNAAIGVSSAVLAILLAGQAAAETGKRFIDIAGVKTVSVPMRTVLPQARSAVPDPAEVAIGSPLPAQYMMLFNPDSLGLPRPRDGWVYFEAGSDIYRVDFSSREVLERVTDQAKPRRNGG